MSGVGRPKPLERSYGTRSAGDKACGGARTIRTNGTIANSAELQKFDRNQKPDVFLIETAEANVRTHHLADPMENAIFSPSCLVVLQIKRPRRSGFDVNTEALPKRKSTDANRVRSFQLPQVWT